MALCCCCAYVNVALQIKTFHVIRIYQIDIWRCEIQTSSNKRRIRSTKITTMTTIRFCWLLLLWHSSQAEDDAPTEPTCKVNADSCGLYMAPSTIPNAGLGVFTVQPLHKGDTVLPAGDVQIPVLEQQWHTDHEDIFWPMSEYYWIGSVMGMGQEAQGEDIEAYCPSFDATLNCNLALINTGKTLPQWDLGGLHRHSDPGAGAITPYHNGTTPVTANVPAGGELFKFYGDDWFETRPKKFGRIPLLKNYYDAELLAKTLTSMDLSKQVREGFWDLVMSKIPWKSRTMNALPSTENLDLVAKEGIRAIHQPSAIRDTAYLQEYGRCIDNILPGPSTIKQAGRGAFATRFLPQGLIITGSPLLIALDRSYLHMYSSKFNNNGDEVRGKVTGHQLLLNYCMGHTESNLLLCPYGTFVNYINHNQTQANVKIQWTPDGIISHNASYLDLKVSEMKGKYQTSLAIDYVALRDIKAGEELFLDYGDDFEEAWSNHVENWKPLEGSMHYADAAMFNTKMKDSVLRTQDEQGIDPYPLNLEIRCHANLRRKFWRNFVWKIDEKGWHCEIVSRETSDEGDILYTVVNDYGRREKGVPRSAISFVDKPYTTDFHLERVFRHEIGIPDDIFPERWRNRVVAEDPDDDDDDDE